MQAAVTEAAGIWLADADAMALALHDWLGPEEVARYRRFVRPQRRRQFLAGRVLLRMALGVLLGVAPRSLVLSAPAGQAPSLLDWPPHASCGIGATPGFSISHSGNWVACAVCANGALGLDIEVRDPARDVLALAGQVFDAQALAQLSALVPAARLAAFYDMWSEREARFKLGAPVASCIVVPHAELSIVLCSALPLGHAPSLTTVALG